MTQPSIIWSIGHNAPLKLSTAKPIIDFGLESGINGLECRPSLHTFLLNKDNPKLKTTISPEQTHANRQELRNIIDYATQRELRLGIWFDLFTPADKIIDSYPDLKTKTGYLDLDSPTLSNVLNAQAKEFCEEFPEINDIIINLSEAMAHGNLPLKDRAQRWIELARAAFESLDKQLVIRPACKDDDSRKAIFDALGDLNKDAGLIIVEQTEPYNWNPFVLNNPFLTKLEQFSLRAETDAAAEHYGRSTIPACYPEYLIERLHNAWEKGCSSFVIRADFAGSTPVGTLNEINLLVATAWIKDHNLDLQQEWQDWLYDRFDAAPDGLPLLLEQTLETIKRALYLDNQPISHDAFPTFAEAKKNQFFHLFEKAPNLKHLTAQPMILGERPSKSHQGLVQEKIEACDMAQALMDWFKTMAPDMTPEAAHDIYTKLEQNLHLCKAMTALVRLTCSHLQETWNLKKPAVNDFDTEATNFRNLATEISTSYGESFFADMPKRMQQFLDELHAERADELPVREAVSKDDTVKDCVFCGFASEGHRLKMAPEANTVNLTQKTPSCRIIHPGPNGTISYELAFVKGKKATIEMDCLNTASIELKLKLGKTDYTIREKGDDKGLTTIKQEVPANIPKNHLQLTITNLTPKPCQLTQIRVRQA